MRGALLLAALAAAVAYDVAGELARLDRALASKERAAAGKRAAGRSGPKAGAPVPKTGAGRGPGNEPDDSVDALRQKLIEMAKQREARNGNVDASSSSSKPPSKFVAAHLPHLFAHFDRDGDGEIGADELEAGLAWLGTGARSAARVIMQRFDKDGDGTLRPAEFRRLALGRRAAPRMRAPAQQSFLELAPRGGRDGGVTAHDRMVQRYSGGFTGMLGGMTAGGRHQAHGPAHDAPVRPAPEFRRSRAPPASKYAQSPRYAEIAAQDAIATATQALERRGVSPQMSAAGAPLLPSLERMAAPRPPVPADMSVLPILPKDFERHAEAKREFERGTLGLRSAPRPPAPRADEPWKAVGLAGGLGAGRDLERAAPSAALAALAPSSSEGISVGPGGNVYTGLKLPPALVNGMNPAFTSYVHKPGSFHSRKLTAPRRRVMSVSPPGGGGYSGFGLGGI